MNNLNSICPLDGRYYEKVNELSDYFSEKALIKYRTIVEIKYFLFLKNIGIANLEGLKNNELGKLNDLIHDFKDDYIIEIKQIEKDCNHDVKSIEYFLQKYFINNGMDKYISFIHFGLTSQDITNTSYNLMINDYIKNSFIQLLEDTTSILYNLSKETYNISMVSKTHGQPASTTTMGKELNVFLYRLSNIRLDNKLYTKFGGAIGNLNAHKVAFPDLDWPDLMNKFIKSLNLERYEFTTQIDPYDGLCSLFDKIRQINNICIDLCRDIWLYVSNNYFKQKIKNCEVGSSTMPHKVNPIDFENAEGNFMLSTAILTFLSNKLPISRLQRDLTDSTVMRNIGIAFGYSHLALKSLKSGLNKLIINKEVILKDLEDNCIIVMEGIQTILRREGIDDAYEKCKSFSRSNDRIKYEDITNFINSLNISRELKTELLNITPENYTGYV